MKIELAPMEGITSYIYRNALAKYYGGIDTYFSPFISTHKDKELNFKEKNEIRSENNEGMILVPQVLTANADEFLYTSGKIKAFGHDHVNINFGCPSGTVTTKGKGSGALTDSEKLEKLLDNIFSQTDIKVSIKTRLGYSDESEWENLLKIYEKFPLEELIVHARIREDFYKGGARTDALKKSDFCNMQNIKTSYNGDVFTVADYQRIINDFPYLDAVMIGRGIIARPWLAAMIKGEPFGGIDTFKSFNLELVEKYNEIMPGEKNTLFKVKELWVYMIKPFEEGELSKSINAGKLLKSIRKCGSLKEYSTIIKTI
ncbi:MAG: tRNA-dihydrouridine synthase family protein [Lachnospiraceae bacterium]|nr:tRNA-dihydrouridine synthase family protein [Lachnospiraceae bacterium]